MPVHIAQRALVGDQGPELGVNRCSELPQFTKLTDRKRAPPSAKSGVRRQAWGFRIGAPFKSGLRERALIFLNLWPGAHLGQFDSKFKRRTCLNTGQKRLSIRR